MTWTRNGNVKMVITDKRKNMTNKKFMPSALRNINKSQKSSDELMSYRLKIRFTEQQKAFIDAAAKSFGMKKTEYCRALILGHRIRDMTQETRKFRLIIANGCNNINQIAWNLNRSGLTEDTYSQVIAMLDWFRQLKENSNKE